MLLSAKWVDLMRDVIDEVPAPVYAVSPEIAERVTGYHVHRGALASMQRKPLPTADELLGATLGAAAADDRTDPGAVPPSGRRERAVRRIAVFEDIVDHANLGAAFRNAAALGIDAVLLTPRCADPFYRRSVKVSMGAVLQVPWTRLESWPKDVEVLRSAGFTLAALCLSERAITLDELAARKDEKLALVFGTEGAASPPVPSPRSTSTSASRWTPVSTRSTWQPPRPSPSTPPGRVRPDSGAPPVRRPEPPRPPRTAGHCARPHPLRHAPASPSSPPPACPSVRLPEPVGPGSPIR